MDEADLAALIEVGKTIYAMKLYMVGAHFWWVYDYLLTLGDEVKYGWAGKKSWVFALFLANRYLPIMFIIWINFFTFDHSCLDSCGSKWVGYFYSIIVTFLAQVAIALRVYAVTQRNRWIAGALSVVIATTLGFGTSIIIAVARTPCINLDAFNTCSVQLGRTGDLVYGYITIVFDTLAFLAILITTKKRGRNRYPGIPSILDNILRDATISFVIVFIYHLVQQFFLIFANSEAVQRAPGILQPILVPIVATHLMLSLKKVAAQPMGPWSVATMTTASPGRATDGTLDFASRVFDVPGETSAPSNEGDMELDSVPSLLRDRGSRQQPC